MKTELLISLLQCFIKVWECRDWSEWPTSRPWSIIWHTKLSVFVFQPWLQPHSHSWVGKKIEAFACDCTVHILAQLLTVWMWVGKYSMVYSVRYFYFCYSLFFIFLRVGFDGGGCWQWVPGFQCCSHCWQQYLQHHVQSHLEKHFPLSGCRKQ